MSVERLVIAGVQSGAGKTTIATGVMAALARRRVVQPFKVGPDYIDSSYHTRVCGRASRNLDTWMVPQDAVVALFNRACGGASIAVIEGVMGLFDGRTGEGQSATTAEVAKLLRAPVVLVVDASRIARSAAAIVHGFRTFDRDLDLAGVILNRVASPTHYAAVAQPIEQEAGIPVLGYLPRDADLALPERYLGLVPTTEGSVAETYFERLRDACERTIDLPRLERIAAQAGHHATGTGSEILFPSTAPSQPVLIAVARDRAFNFYYEDNLDLLRAWGAEIAEFSPLSDEVLPGGARAVYLGGGFPELFAEELAANEPMLAALRRAANAGMPVYGECGGLMYLREKLVDADGRGHALAAVLPGRSVMRGGRLTLGYREIRALQASAVSAAGTELRAHEFHWSADERPAAAAEAMYAVSGGGRVDGYCRGSVAASYMHLHFAGSPAIAPRFVAAARDWQRPEPVDGSLPRWPRPSISFNYRRSSDGP